ncbi:hypothetical protein KI387_023259, partial [Taxus chinensis]
EEIFSEEVESPKKRFLGFLRSALDFFLPLCRFLFGEDMKFYKSMLGKKSLLK